MRQRGVSNVATVVIAATVALLVAPLFMGFVILDVNVKGPDRHHFWLPIPIGFARVALAFVPSERVACEAPRELVKNRELILAAIDSLASCGDATLVSVRSADANVRIAVAGGKLRLDVDDRGTNVHGSFRIEAVRHFLEHWDGRELDPGSALDMVAGMGRGELLAVSSPDADVSIKLW